jgi:pimeloyl-ACP methyl ester carboxylesterase
VTKLALASVALPIGAATAEDKKWYEETIKSCHDDWAKCAWDFTANIFHKPASAEYSRWHADLGRIASPYAVIRGLEWMRDYDHTAELGKITIPTRIYHGAYDKVLPYGKAEALQKLIKGSTLWRFENSGHALYWDEKDKFVDELDKYVGEALAKAA